MLLRVLHPFAGDGVVDVYFKTYGLLVSLAFGDVVKLEGFGCTKMESVGWVTTLGLICFRSFTWCVVHVLTCSMLR